MTSPIGEAASVVLPRRLDPADPERLLAGLAGKASQDALEVCDARIEAAYAGEQRNNRGQTPPDDGEPPKEDA